MCMTSCCADRPSATLQSLLPSTHFLIQPLQPHSLTIAFHLLDAMALTCADRPSCNTLVTPSLHALVHMSSFNHSNLILSPSPFMSWMPWLPARVACRVQRANDAESCTKWEASLRSDGTWADVDYADKTRLGVPVPCTATMPLHLRSRSHHHPLPFCADSTFSSVSAAASLLRHRGHLFMPLRMRSRLHHRPLRCCT